MLQLHYALTDTLITNRTYMRDVVETTHIFFKLMEKFCNGSVVVQDKKKSRAKSKKSKKSAKTSNNDADADDDDNNEVSRLRDETKIMSRYYAKQDFYFVFNA